MWGDNANVETLYYGVSWMIGCVIREHDFHAKEQGDFCEFCGFCVQKYLTQTTQTGADFTPHGIRVIWIAISKERTRKDWLVRPAIREIREIRVR